MIGQFSIAGVKSKDSRMKRRQGDSPESNASQEDFTENEQNEIDTEMDDFQRAIEVITQSSNNVNTAQEGSTLEEQEHTEIYYGHELDAKKSIAIKNAIQRQQLQSHSKSDVFFSEEPEGCWP